MMFDEAELQVESAERTLIGLLGAAPHSIAGVITGLPGADFYHLNRGRVWDAARALIEAQQLISPPTLVRQLSTTGDLDAGTEYVATQEIVRELSFRELDRAALHAGGVADMARRRELCQALKRGARLVMEHPGDTSEIASAVRAEFEGFAAAAQDADPGTLAWPELLAEFEQHHDPSVELRGIETPWAELNEMLGDLHGGRMYVIGGSAGDGKSTAALNIAAHAAAGKEPVLVFSKEMPSVDVTGRLVARGAEIDLRTINSRRLSQYDRERFEGFAHDTADYRLWVNAQPVSMQAIKRITRNVHSRYGLSLLVVDYLQLMTGEERGRSAEEEIARISTELKTLAMELNLAVVVPAQLNRNPSARQDQRPTKADLRQSGRIEQDADVVILLWRKPIPDGPQAGEPDPYNLTLIVDKNRHGPKGQVQLRWNGGYGVIGSTGRTA